MGEEGMRDVGRLGLEDVEADAAQTPRLERCEQIVGRAHERAARDVDEQQARARAL